MKPRACRSLSTPTSVESTLGTRLVPLPTSPTDPLLTPPQADIYSHGKSERIIGKALKTYSIPRSKVVILSKCYFGVREEETSAPISASSTNNDEMVNQVGLSRKHIFDAVEKSVERLGTYIDVLQIHRLDRDTPREEIMKALNDVVERGWVRYLGASSVSIRLAREVRFRDLC
jgi:aryl-alcohol dehydrogenase-like predicted oxidoreductase